MHRDLETHRKVLVLAYRRYLVAERDLQRARTRVSRWLPETPAHGAGPIGDPGSPVRRLYEARDRAVARLSLARMSLKDAHRRLDMKTGAVVLRLRHMR